MKRTLLTLTLAAALCLPALFAQKSAAEEPIVLTFNLGMPPIHQRWVNAIKPWCDELEKRSNGRIKIEPYFANALGKRSDAMDSPARSPSILRFFPPPTPAWLSAMPMTC